MANHTQGASHTQGAPAPRDNPPPKGAWRRDMIIGVTLAALGAVLVLGAGVLALLHGGGSTPEPVAGGPTTSASARPSGSSGPITATGPSASASSNGKTVFFLHDGDRAPTDLDEATVTLPPFTLTQCPSGRTQFHAGKAPDPTSPDGFNFGTAITAVAVVDVTGDGAPEHVALVSCKEATDPGGYAAQVVALKSGTDGTYTSIGVVYGVGGGATFLAQLQVDSARMVKVLVEPLATGQTTTPRAWHSFKWSGSAFVPNGTTAVPPQTTTTKLGVTLQPTTLQLSTDLNGQLTYTITNKGGAAPTTLRVEVDSTLPLAVTVPGALGPLSRVDVGANHVWAFVIAATAVNASVSGTMVLALDPAAAATAPKSAPVTVTITGYDIDLVLANATTANKATLTLTRP
jgi:hypothetical protein